MPKKQWTPEERAEASAKAKARIAAKKAIAVEVSEPVPPKPTPAKGLKKLGLTGTPSDQSAFRSVKVVRPRCQQQVVGNDGRPQSTTGPCQQAVSRNARLRYSWFKTCTHGPTTDEDGNAIPPERRPYYGESLGQRPVLRDGKMDIEWGQTIAPNTAQVALSEHTGGLTAAQEEMRKGALPISEFGLAPFCDHYNCWSQEVQTFPNITSGLFCSAYHAAMVKLRESGEIMCLPLPDEWTGIGVARRQKQLQDAMK